MRHIVGGAAEPRPRTCAEGRAGPRIVRGDSWEVADTAIQATPRKRGHPKNAEVPELPLTWLFRTLPVVDWFCRLPPHHAGFRQGSAVVTAEGAVPQGHLDRTPTLSGVDVPLEFFADALKNWCRAEGWSCRRPPASRPPRRPPPRSPCPRDESSVCATLPRAFRCPLRTLEVNASSGARTDFLDLRRLSNRGWRIRRVLIVAPAFACFEAVVEPPVDDLNRRPDRSASTMALGPIEAHPCR